MNMTSWKSRVKASRIWSIKRALETRRHALLNVCNKHVNASGTGYTHDNCTSDYIWVCILYVVDVLWWDTVFTLNTLRDSQCHIMPFEVSAMQKTCPLRVRKSYECEASTMDANRNIFGSSLLPRTITFVLRRPLDSDDVHSWNSVANLSKSRERERCCAIEENWMRVALV